MGRSSGTVRDASTGFHGLSSLARKLRNDVLRRGNQTMSHPIIRALGDYLQLSSTQGLLRALQLEPRRSLVSRTLSSFKLLGTGIIIGRGIDMYAETLIDYAGRGRKRPRALWTAGALAVGAAVGVGAVILLVPEITAELSGRAKNRSPSPSASASYPVDAPAAASGETASTNGATG
jgi:hypothetical protein